MGEAQSADRPRPLTLEKWAEIVIQRRDVGLCKHPVLWRVRVEHDRAANHVPECSFGSCEAIALGAAGHWQHYQ